MIFLGIYILFGAVFASVIDSAMGKVGCSKCGKIHNYGPVERYALLITFALCWILLLVAIVFSKREEEPEE